LDAEKEAERLRLEAEPQKAEAEAKKAEAAAHKETENNETRGASRARWKRV